MKKLMFIFLIVFSFCLVAHAEQAPGAAFGVNEELKWLPMSLESLSLRGTCVPQAMTRCVVCDGTIADCAAKAAERSEADETAAASLCEPLECKKDKTCKLGAEPFVPNGETSVTGYCRTKIGTATCTFTFVNAIETESMHTSSTIGTDPMAPGVKIQASQDCITALGTNSLHVFSENANCECA